MIRNSNLAFQNKTFINKYMSKEKESFKATLKELFDKGKNFVRDADEVITEELKGNEFVEYLKTKAKDVQVKVDEVYKNFTTEEIFAEEVGNDLIISLVLNGLTKEDITIEAEDNKLLVNVDDSKVSKELRKYWSVSKTKLFYDFTQFEESALIENTTSKFDNGILTITIPRKERTKEKKKFTIQ